MKRWHFLILFGSIAAAAWPLTRPESRQVEPRFILPNPLCREAFRTRETGFGVRVPLRYSLKSTDDPRTFDYYPFVPPAFAPTLRVIFRREPHGFKLPVTIIGTVSGVVPDDQFRASGLLGIVVISDARIVPPCEP